jgi:hypothetical protein
MNEMPTLRTALLDLLYELRDTDIQLIIGGGYGIYLRTHHVLEKRQRTLLGVWPEARSTNDLDLFLRPELLTHSAKLKPLADAITRLKYKVVEGAKKFQFVKPGPGGTEAGSLKIDLLTAPQTAFAGTGLKVDKTRVRPNPSVGIHAHPCDQLVTLEEKLLRVPFSGKRSSGEPWQAEVFLPHPYSFLLMKLFAFRDRIDDPQKELGRHHALDLYSVIALTNEPEWQECRDFSHRLQNEPVIIEAGQIVAEHFSGLEQPGLLRLREHAYFRPEFQLPEFISALIELFRPRTGHTRG